MKNFFTSAGLWIYLGLIPLVLSATQEKETSSSDNMVAYSAALFALTTMAAVAQAAPEVTPVLDDRGCAAYPQYEPATGFIARFTVQVNQCHDPAGLKPCPIERHGAGSQSLIVDGEEDVSSGYITVITNLDGAQGRFTCEDGVGVQGQTDDPDNFGYSSLAVADKAKAAHLMWGLSGDESIPIEPYHHEIDGEEQEGTFWGSQNVTTWAIKYENHGAGRYYWLPRLLLPGAKPLQEGEFQTFLRIADYWTGDWP